MKITSINIINRNSFFISIIIILFCSCEQTVDDIKFPETPPKLVVYSYISTSDTLLRVYVSMSVSMYNASTNNQGQDIKDATVIMWNAQGSSITIPYNQYDNCYVISSSAFPIEAGKTYNLKVTRGDKTAEASCTVPSQNNTTLQIISVDSTINEFNENTILVKVRFQDSQGQGDYYRIIAAGWSYQYYSTGIDSTYHYMFETQGEEIISDKDKDGLTFGREFTYSEMYQGGYENSQLDHINISLLHTDKDYYEFHKSINNYSGDGPFSEPTLIYSNMQGGYGVFAAYSSYSIRVDL